MHSRPRFRRLLKWTGTIACVVLILVTAVSLKWRLFAISDNASVFIGRGFVVAARYRVSILSPYFPPPPLFDDAALADDWSNLEFWPRYQSFELRDRLTIPLWIPFVLIGIPTAFLWRLDRRRPLPGHCRRCNYDLTGNTSGKCPECGTPRAG